MEFLFSEDQEQFRENIARFLGGSLAYYRSSQTNGGR